MSRKRCPICDRVFGLLSLQDHIACGLLGGRTTPEEFTRDMKLSWWCLCGFESNNIDGLLIHLDSFEHDWPTVLVRRAMESM